ncbi:arsenosugar biosynthesis radical SAM (seleno)protein ArsS [Aporhodopirellula aestuarii]|uniref:Arsenosugar biosynthesis radical SAM protein ArsS n=1 Tax=Aporhodopirellula aestuarii TaxID=2950107 RepID=A0ABT0U832_9BACT|nr:arsenosugar biosynthesis radical SAM (seleno)protein ArsS [Aporhodopirellula aestuarii]MCM2373072.1 arsenosugar biosynthesis radical SAM protein ArsS [Aporhodopirellula aestuarii]
MLPIVQNDSPTGVVTPFSQRIRANGERFLRRELSELQINLGKLCNQTCTHCHVDAGPTKRRENMSADVARRVMELAMETPSLKTIDLTGGAPEMNPHFREMAKLFRDAGIRVIDRCNLTILSEPGYEWVAPFLADNGIDVIASLPCYLEDNVDSQRGEGVFTRSIEGLRRLNELGYAVPGKTDGRLRLDLVYNPTGPHLPPAQDALEVDYRRELRNRYAIEFDSLLAITNIPIRRYAQYLRKRGVFDDYLKMLADAFNPAAIEGVMCRSLISIGWDGRIYDCDFNQMVDLSIESPTVWTIESLSEFVERPIALADHCYGCTAGAGSSCSGSLT